MKVDNLVEILEIFFSFLKKRAEDNVIVNTKKQVLASEKWRKVTDLISCYKG